MSALKRVFAAMTAAVLLITLAACHKKDEIALNIGGINIKGSLYLAYLLQADQEARSKVDESKSSTSSGTSSATTSSQTKYLKELIEGKSYNTWVKEKALEYAKEYAAVTKLFSEYKLKLSNEDKSSIDNYVNMYWSYYGLGDFYTKNGVSKATYTEVLTNSYMRNSIFNYYYDEGGTKEVSAKDKKTALEKLYVLANTIQINFSSTDDSGNTKTLTDAEKKAAKTKLDGYAKRLKSGTSFAKIKAEYDKEEAAKTESSSFSSATSSTTTSTVVSSGSTSTTTSAATSSSVSSAVTSSADSSSGTSSESKPKDENATAYGSSESSSASDYYDKIKEMKKGDIKVLEFDDSYMLAVRKDILGDSYYLKTYNAEILNFLKGDEFEADLSKYMKDLKVEEHSFVTDNYTPKKVDYTSSAY